MDLNTLTSMYYDTGWLAGAIEALAQPGYYKLDGLRKTQEGRLLERTETLRIYEDEQRALLRGAMSRQELSDALDDSNRWGAENQPPRERMMDMLDQVGVAAAVVTRDDTLVIDLARDFDMGALIELIQASDFSQTNKRGQIVLWWD